LLDSVSVTGKIVLCSSLDSGRIKPSLTSAAVLVSEHGGIGMIYDQ
jgi:hypothetical protein